MTSTKLPACLTETDMNCYWDADTMGNGLGEDFVNCDGTVIYTYVNAGNDYTADFIPNCPSSTTTTTEAPSAPNLPTTGIDATGICMTLAIAGAIIISGFILLAVRTKSYTRRFKD